MNVLNILVGFLLLLVGRRLFWLFVGVVGFITGMNLAMQYLDGQSQWVILVIGLIAGLIGGVLAVLFQRIAVAVAGYLAGSYLSTFLLTVLGVDMGQFVWIIAVIGGILGAVLVFVLFDWALIILSGMVGASMAAQALTPEPQEQTILFVLLALTGIVIQAGLMQRHRPVERTVRRTMRRRRRT